MFTEQDILLICKYYTKDTVSFELMGVSHNIVYRINCNTPFILRITPSKHRTMNELLSEIDFLMFLHQKGANVNRPILSLNKSAIIECDIHNETYYITAFSIADGLNWIERNDDDRRIDVIGQALGKIHNISKQYKPCNAASRRNSLESQHLTKGFSIFSDYDIQVYNKYLSFIDELKALPKDSQSYGLTHGDFLFSNYNITQDNKVSVFDFDECEYSWFISDIAVCIYYYLLGGNPSELTNKTQEAKSLMSLFMSGYIKENRICANDFEKIDLFFRQRDYILLSTILGRGDKELNWWDKAFVEGALNRIINNKPFVDVRFSELFNSQGG